MSAADERLTPHIEAIGKFIIAFSRLEQTLRGILGYGLELNRFSAQTFDVVTKTYDFAMLCKICNHLAGDLPRYKQYKIEIQRMIKDCMKINDARTKVAHGFWGWGAGTTHMSRNSLKIGRAFRDTKDLIDLTNVAERIATRLLEISYETYVRHPILSQDESL